VFPESLVTMPEWLVTIPGMSRSALDFFNFFRHLGCFL
jgi:hypothetical protein